MKDDEAHYDDDFELTEYVWRAYPELITGFEHRVGKYECITDTAATEIKSPAFTRYLVSNFGPFNESDADRGKLELAAGLCVYRRKVRNRVLKDNPEAVLINRCPKCQQILTSPKTRQCLRCHLSWHNATPEQAIHRSTELK